MAKVRGVNGKAEDHTAASGGDGTGVVTLSAPASSAWVSKAAAASAVLLLILASGFYVLRRQSGAEIPPTKPAMLAVLPFQNLSNDSEQEYFNDGLTEDTISDVGQLGGNATGDTVPLVCSSKNEIVCGRPSSLT